MLILLAFNHPTNHFHVLCNHSGKILYYVNQYHAIMILSILVINKNLSAIW